MLGDGKGRDAIRPCAIMRHSASATSARAGGHGSWLSQNRARSFSKAVRPDDRVAAGVFFLNRGEALGERPVHYANLLVGMGQVVQLPVGPPSVSLPLEAPTPTQEWAGPALAAPTTALNLPRYRGSPPYRCCQQPHSYTGSSKEQPVSNVALSALLGATPARCGPQARRRFSSIHGVLDDGELIKHRRCSSGRSDSKTQPGRYSSRCAGDCAAG